MEMTISIVRLRDYLASEFHVAELEPDSAAKDSRGYALERTGCKAFSNLQAVV